MHWEPMVPGVRQLWDTLIPVFDSPNEGGPRRCEYSKCQRPMPEKWPAVYCSTKCALADTFLDDVEEDAVVTNIEPGSELDKAAADFFQAARAYREAIKKYLPEERHGVIWLEWDGELVLHSESSKYTRQIASMTFDRYRDEVVFFEVEEEGDE